MNYTRIYENLTKQNLRVKTKENYYEKHHIIPKCLGGSNDKCNLVLLTPKEHFIAHLLLTKMYTGEAHKKMCFAFWRMHNSKYGYKPSAKQYESARIILKQAMAELNKGKTFKHTEETKKKIGKGNKGKVRTEEMKQKVSIGNKGRIQSEELREKRSKIRIGTKLSKETKDKISKIHKGKKVADETKLLVSNSITEHWKTRARTWKISKPITIKICEMCSREIGGEWNYKQHQLKCANQLKILT